MATDQNIKKQARPSSGRSEAVVSAFSKAREAFSVTYSLQGARWILASADLDQVDRYMKFYCLPEIIARLLCIRGVPFQSVDEFLNPSLREHFPDPSSLAGMDAAASDLASAIKAGRKIGIFADFDVDGSTSAALLVRFLRHCGIDAPVYIPDRLTEGYGPNIEAFKKLREQGITHLLVADCGVTSFDVMDEARKIGLHVTILDHHEPEADLPSADHIIDPKRPDCASGLSMLSACGVCFMLCVATNTLLRERGYYKHKDLREPVLKNFLELVAISTICDMVPLTAANRLLVRSGMAVLNRRTNPGLKALMEVAKLEGVPGVTDVGFAIGPRINAGSRVHRSDLGARLMATDNPEEAMAIALELDECNKKRRAMQAQMFKEAAQKVEGDASDAQSETHMICVDGEDWHPGLSGLVAGQLKERFGQPACVVVWGPDGRGGIEGKGSGRSIPGVNMASAFIDARREGLLLKGGGHAMAGGFTIAPEHYEAFQAFMEDHVTRQLTGEDVSILEREIDVVASVRGITPQVVHLLEDQVGPFGEGFREPLFALPNIRVHSADPVGRDHVRALISDWEGGPRIKCVAFRSAELPLGRALLDAAGGRMPLHLAGYLKLNVWQGRESAEMHIVDAARLTGAAE